MGKEEPEPLLEWRVYESFTYIAHPLSESQNALTFSASVFATYLDTPIFTQL